MAQKEIIVVMRESNRADGNGPLVPLCVVETELMAREIITSTAYTRKYAFMGVAIQASQADYLIRKIPVVETFADFACMV